MTTLGDMVDEIKAGRIDAMLIERATKSARHIVNTSQSEEQIRTRLTNAGFNGDAAAVSTKRSKDGRMFMAMVMVRGPGGEIISV